MTNYCAKCVHSVCTSRVPVFSGLSPEELGKIASLIKHEYFSKGETVFFEGDPATNLAIVNKGEIKLFKQTKEGKEQILDILGAGEFFGELNLLQGATHTYFATALSDVTLCSLSREDFNQLITDNPVIALKVLQELGERLIRLENLVQSLATNDVDARLAQLLLNLGEKARIKTKNGIEVDLSLTREDMASFLGVTRETVSRKLRLFHEQGLITLKGNKRLIIRNTQQLKDLITP